MHGGSSFTIIVEAPDSGERLDLFVASRISDCSRSAAGNLIREGKIRVQGAIQKPGYRVRSGDEIYGDIQPPESISFLPEPIEIEILHEDNHLIVLNKRPGIVVHPAPGHYTGTLVNALLYHCPKIDGIGGKLRPGIVHRLDKDTSGTLVVAKNARTHNHLALQFKSRKVKKEYLSLVYGEMGFDSGTISLPIGRHPVDRKKMSTQSRKSRYAETSWRVRERFQGATLIELHLKTGRTHQIRVHCAAIRHPIVGDVAYGGRISRKRVSAENDLLRAVPRQMLHAWRLGFVHPATESFVSFEAPVPQDFEKIIEALRQNK